ncbi:Replication protein A 32 kDa subunit-like protein [Leptotrombidium deliense]|uniref:Replication protein A 32 kDa subunit-like protein n=1 Tax=Leptotrombidium deliense TaxID=299467 RepID=A0A443SG11_9ACAR|nr:Replication protein A 32 kDa subunit-like protein [Leptotrombidium deliense]
MWSTSDIDDCGIGFMKFDGDTSTPHNKTRNRAVTCLNKAQQVVLDRVASVDTPEGISFEELVFSVHSMNERSIRETLELLSRWGHIFSTIDNNHYKAMYPK